MKIPAGKELKSLTIVVAVLVLLPRLVWAHHFMDGGLPKTFAQGFLSGMGHPVIGLDHAAFVVAAGFVLALVKGGMSGIVALIVGSVVGAVLHLLGLDLPGGEVGVALSVILIGGLVMARAQIRLAWLEGGLSLAGMLHGYAYAESIFGAEPAPLGAYLVGFTIVQLGIATAVFVTHRRLIATRDTWVKPLSSALGVVVGAIGVVFFVVSMSN